MGQLSRELKSADIPVDCYLYGQGRARNKGQG